MAQPYLMNGAKSLSSHTSIKSPELQELMRFYNNKSTTSLVSKLVIVYASLIDSFGVKNTGIIKQLEQNYDYIETLRKNGKFIGNFCTYVKNEIKVVISQFKIINGKRQTSEFIKDLKNNDKYAVSDPIRYSMIAFDDLLNLSKTNPNENNFHIIIHMKNVFLQTADEITQIHQELKRLNEHNVFNESSNKLWLSYMLNVYTQKMRHLEENYNNTVVFIDHNDTVASANNVYYIKGNIVDKVDNVGDNIDNKVDNKVIDKVDNKDDIKTTKSYALLAGTISEETKNKIKIANNNVMKKNAEQERINQEKLNKQYVSKVEQEFFGDDDDDDNDDE